MKDSSPRRDKFHLNSARHLYMFAQISCLRPMDEELHWMRLLLHPFMTKHEKLELDLAAFVWCVFDPLQGKNVLADNPKPVIGLAYKQSQTETNISEGNHPLPLVNAQK